MNRLAPNIPNKIKQPAKCCIYCGKSYIINWHEIGHIHLILKAISN